MKIMRTPLPMAILKGLAWIAYPLLLGWVKIAGWIADFYC